jgi:hypothetical protein
MTILATLLQVLVAVVVVNGSPLERRGTRPTDQIVGLAEAVTTDNTGILYETYQPYLDVLNGCVPFPAVDINGNTKYESFLQIVNDFNHFQPRSSGYWHTEQRLQ